MGLPRVRQRLTLCYRTVLAGSPDIYRRVVPDNRVSRGTIAGMRVADLRSCSPVPPDVDVATWILDHLDRMVSATEYTKVSPQNGGRVIERCYSLVVAGKYGMYVVIDVSGCSLGVCVAVTQLGESKTCPTRSSIAISMGYLAIWSTHRDVLYQRTTS